MSNIMPARQPTDTCHRKNIDKAAEPLQDLVKLWFLGQKIVKIGASQAPQSESPPASELSYPASTINLCGSTGPSPPQR